ncbi:JmjC domain-containing protein 7 [Cytospora mali]|uniref:JmjC domain-containing protein 7 n=1 Tax=Cytospora mali TaxID=578113 RepID=A0A194UYT8_CYTMA|nr:JmjC domain-containing protein 7 [Valsa mali var. pyri (nom. inval.)]
MEQSAADPLAELITTHNELNSPIIEELDGEPSPLEFMRYVSRNTPFVVRNAAAAWPATKTWNAHYLETYLRHQTVNVAVTPKGNADSPTRHDENGELVFAKPWEEDQPFPEFLDYVRRQETDVSFPKDSEIRYAQTQNDNLRHEYISLFSQVQRDIPFARIALEKEPEAINMWIGNSHSVTALHKDNYENIYVQIQGQKHFVLLPSHCYPCVNEKLLRPATYVRSDNNDGLRLVMDAGEEGQEKVEPVPFAIWDPDCPDDNATPYSRLAEPMRVTLEPGDMLYLPAMW